jgi:hypothetical protein
MLGFAMDDPITQMLRFYCNIMSEIRTRLETVRSLPENTTLGAVTRYELSFLQFRMICELIALACLAAHGDIAETRSTKMREAYAADWILKQLERLHPDFYPIAGEAIDLKVGLQVGVQIKPLMDGFLTKAELKKLYAQTGSVLHRGTIENLAPLMPKADFAAVLAWESRIRTLLTYHHIPLLDGKTSIWVMLDGLHGRPTASVFHRVTG